MSALRSADFSLSSICPDRAPAGSGAAGAPARCPTAGDADVCREASALTAGGRAVIIGGDPRSLRPDAPPHRDGDRRWPQGPSGVRPRRLPHRFTPHFGSEREVSALAALLRHDGVGLVTLTGPASAFTGSPG